jgi:hypothetical protein
MSADSWLRGGRGSACAVLFATCLAGAAARAGDGVLEIDATCAIAGCFPGDAPGYPVEITQMGSYRLTSDLDVSSPIVRTTAILVLASYVTIDLAGFTLTGEAACSSTICSPVAPTYRGVDASAAEGVEVRNGVIEGMEIGVATGRLSRVVDLRMRSTFTGVEADAGSRVDGCSVLRGKVGVTLGTDLVAAGGIVSRTRVRETLEDGILGFADGSLLFTNDVRDVPNGPGPFGKALYADDAGLVAGNTVLGGVPDDSFAIHARSALVIDNVVFDAPNQGIVTTSGAISVNRNTVRGSGDYGLGLATTDSAYRDNVLTSYANGPVQGGVVVGSGNHCAGAGTVAPTCP